MPSPDAPVRHHPSPLVTRTRLQMGIRRLRPVTSLVATVADIGCGMKTPEPSKPQVQILWKRMERMLKTICFSPLPMGILPMSH